MLQHAAVFIILVLVPAAGFLMARKLKENRSSSAKLSSYAGNIVFLLAASVIILIGYGPERVLYFDGDIHIGRTAMLVVAACFVFFLFSAVLPLLLMRTAAFRIQLRQVYADKSYIFPITPKEKALFIALTLCVGIGEEIIYRFFLVEYLLSEPYSLPLFTAFAASAVLFGLTHWLQGISGIMNATVVGVLLTYVYISTGSLWLPIVLHALYDMKLLWVASVALKLEPSGDESPSSAPQNLQ